MARRLAAPMSFAVVLVCFLALCPPDGGAQPPEQQAPQPERPVESGTGSAPPKFDPVVAAAIANARTLEGAESQEARSIYEAVIQNHAAVWCDAGPVGFQCAHEARRRLRILDCVAKRSAPTTASDSAALAATIVRAVRDDDRAALTKHAACDFSFGPCYSDAGTNDVPAPAFACLARIVRADVQLAPSPDEASETWARYPLSSSPVLSLELRRPDSSAEWTWSGVCYDKESPCDPE